METHTIDMSNGWSVDYRDWTRGQVKHLSEQEFTDFLLDECIVELRDGEGDVHEVDDVPYRVLAHVVHSIAEGLDPNGRRGSRRR